MWCMHAGHTNVHYVGDRVRKEAQLNGKSANLNHVLFTKIYPFVTSAGAPPASLVTYHARTFTHDVSKSVPNSCLCCSTVMCLSLIHI